MNRRHGPWLLALSAVLLRALHGGGSASSAASASPSERGGTNDWGPRRERARHAGPRSNDHGGRPDAPTPRGESGLGEGPVLPGTGSNVSAVISGRTRSRGTEDSGATCAYRVTEGGIGGQLCFRHSHLGFQCAQAGCRTVASPGSLVANIFTNGSVLLRWANDGEKTQGHGPRMTESGAGQHTSAGAELAKGGKGSPTPTPRFVSSNGPRRRGGFELSCWWNGSYTQFECAGVRLGSSCRDFLFTELHENVPYRICLRALAAGPGDCVEFTVSPSGMQDVVIAMTTVGGAICVMLVIICLLVAYITENIMSPATQHTYSYHTHSRH